MSRSRRHYGPLGHPAQSRHQGHRDRVTEADTSPSVAFCPRVPCPRAPPPPRITSHTVTGAQTTKHAAGDALTQPINSTERGRRMKMSSRVDEKLTVKEVCAELRISRRTFYEWRAKGRAPRCIPLPNGALLVRRSELDRWLTEREDAA